MEHEIIAAGAAGAACGATGGSLYALITSDSPLTRSIAKLVDTLGGQVGLYLESGNIVRRARAEADVKIQNARADAEVRVIKTANKHFIQDLQERAAERVRNREERRQKNLENILLTAAREMPEKVSDEAVDADWTADFINASQDVSDEQMQSLWARLLAGEVAQPGTFSRRTLAAVKVLSHTEADLFTRLCRMNWVSSVGIHPIIPNTDAILSVDGIWLTFEHLVTLDSIGLIKMESVVTFRLNVHPQNFLAATYFGKLFKFSMENSSEFAVGNVMLTELGKQLARISGATASEEYLRWMVETVGASGWKVETGSINW